MGAATSTARSAGSPPPFKQSFVRLTWLQAFDVLAFSDVASREIAPLDAATIERLAAVDGADAAAVGFQRIVRRRIVENFFDRFRSAQYAGVMLAFRDTVQGQSGWYVDCDLIQYHFAVEELPATVSRTAPTISSMASAASAAVAASRAAAFAGDRWWWLVVNNAELAHHRKALKSCDVLVAREGTASGESGAYFELPAGTSKVSRRTTSSEWEVGPSWRRRTARRPEDVRPQLVRRCMLVAQNELGPPSELVRRR